MRMREVEIQCFKHCLWRSSRIHRTVVTFVTIGLLKRLSSKQFVLDLALMYDALHELALLSESLQKGTTSLTYADRLINRSIRVIDGIGEHSGTKVLAALTALSEGRLSTVLLGDNPKTVSIDRQQFLRSLSNNLRHRCLPLHLDQLLAPRLRRTMPA